MLLAKNFKELFQTAERTRALLREWKPPSLKDLVTTNRKKTPSACLDVLIAKLVVIQMSLCKEYGKSTILQETLLNAARDVDYFRLAYHNPAESVQSIISGLHASLASAKNSTTFVSSTHPPDD